MNDSKAAAPKDESTDTHPANAATRIKNIIKETYSVLLPSLVLLFLTLVVGFGIGLIDGASMEPTFSDGGFIITFRVRDCSSLRRGDVVTFRSDAATDAGCIKRIVGLPGDTVEARDGILYVDGQEAGPSGGIMWTWGSYVVPEDSLFVVGDNRALSYDSRAYGAIQFSQVISKVIWPNTQFP